MTQKAGGAVGYNRYGIQQASRCGVLMTMQILSQGSREMKGTVYEYTNNNYV
jgi:hypothetical protein